MRIVESDPPNVGIPGQDPNDLKSQKMRNNDICAPPTAIPIHHKLQRLSAKKGGCVWRTTSCVARVVSWDGCDRCSTSQRRISQRRNPIQHTGIGMIFGFLLKTRVCRHCELQKGQLGLSFGKGRGIRTKGGAAAVPEEESHI